MQQELEQGLEQGLEEDLKQGLEQGLEEDLKQGLEQGLEQGLQNNKKRFQYIKNRALLALAYKLIDNYPNMTLFGGIVREIIAPAYIYKTYPFSNKFETSYDLSDIDIIYQNDRIINPYVELKNLIEGIRPRLRGWDWFVKQIDELNIYQVKGFRVFLENQIIDISTHLDIIIDPKSQQDVNVNELRFNKNNGLFLSDFGYKHSIKDNFFKSLEYDNIINHIKLKECMMTVSLFYEGKENRESVITLRLRRFVKMLKNGWNILNKSKNILLSYSFSNKNQCMICHNQIKMHNLFINLNCSQCHLCMDCFEELLTKNFNFEDKTFKCPTCRLSIIPYE